MSETQGTLDKVLFTLLRFSIGWTFFFGFIDKAFGLQYQWTEEKTLGTDPASSWFAGGSPTTGFLKFATTDKWFADLFSPMAGSGFVDFLFMMGLLGVGLAMMFGIGRKIAAVSGGLIMFLMWLASLPLEHNPFMDDHLINLLALLILGFTSHYGVTILNYVPALKNLVEKYPILA